MTMTHRRLRAKSAQRNPVIVPAAAPAALPRNVLAFTRISTASRLPICRSCSGELDKLLATPSSRIALPRIYFGDGFMLHGL
jgi:hypothetical protein